MQSLALNGLLGTNGTWSACRRLNESVCVVSQSADSFSVALFNPLGQARKEYMQFPVRSANVVVMNELNNEIPSQVLPIRETITNYARNTNEASFVVMFEASLPAMGVVVYNIKVSAAESAAQVLAPQRGADVVIENEFVSLTFSGVTGRLASWINKDTNTRVNVSQSFCFYKSNTGDKDSGQRSGAYIFRPSTNECFPISLRPDGVTQIDQVIRGPLVQEIRQTFSPWLTQTVRLNAG